MNLEKALELMNAVEDADRFDNDDNAEFRTQYNDTELQVLRLNFKLDNYFMKTREPGNIPPIDCVRSLVDVATAVYAEIRRLDSNYTVKTDFDCAYGELGSPWVEHCETPEEFVFAYLSFDCESDERMTDLQSAPEIEALSEIAGSLKFQDLYDNPERYFPADEDQQDQAQISAVARKAYINGVRHEPATV